MIPKQLFFIWIGDSKPDYIDFSINVFKNVNSKFRVDLIYYTKDEFLNCDDDLLNVVKDFVFKTHKGIKNKYFKYIKHRINSKFNFIQIVSDVLRFELLYYYGGIYLDCDTFPVKEFDNKLLNLDCFSQSVLALKPKNIQIENLHYDFTKNYTYGFVNNLKQYDIYTYNDIYFLGSVKNYTETEFDFTESLYCKCPLNPPWIRNFDNDKSYLKVRDKFYKCEIKQYEDFLFYNYYIMHFPSRAWQVDYKKSKMYCELDDYLYGGSK